VQHLMAGAFKRLNLVEHDALEASTRVEELACD
jgi:hypothetical protein